MTAKKKDVSRETVNLETNDWDLYPRREDVSIRSIDRLSDGVGVQLSLLSSLEEHSHFLYTAGDSPFQKSEDGIITVRFEDNHKPESQSRTTTVKAVSETEVHSEPKTITINYYPKELYAAGGQTAPGWIIVQNTDLALSSSCVEDWILQHPALEEKEYAQEKWGHLIADGRPEHENACALARSIIDDLESHRGVPSDEMGKLSPFEQYERVMAGKDRLWCGNIAGIFSYACNALGIPCRGIGMNHRALSDQPDEEENILLLAEGHGTTEIFSEQLNQWIWIDLTFYILGAYLGEEGPITMAELYRYLNAPNRLKSLRIVVYDPKNRTEEIVPVMESDKRGSLFNYFKRDQRFYYAKANGEK